MIPGMCKICGCCHSPQQPPLPHFQTFLVYYSSFLALPCIVNITIWTWWQDKGEGGVSKSEEDDQAGPAPGSLHVQAVEADTRDCQSRSFVWNAIISPAKQSNSFQSKQGEFYNWGAGGSIPPTQPTNCVCSPSIWTWGGGEGTVCGLGFKINMTQNFGKDNGGKWKYIRGFLKKDMFVGEGFIDQLITSTQACQGRIGDCLTKFHSTTVSKKWEAV